ADFCRHHHREQQLEMVARAVRACFRALSCVLAVVHGLAAFNLDLDKSSVYSGPEASYFGYSVDFYHPTQDRSAMAVLVGAPKANTSQPGIVEGGAVYYCPWPSSQPDSCRQIPFDKANNRMIKVNGTREPLEFKSHQWFGATVRTHRGKVVVTARQSCMVGVSSKMAEFVCMCFIDILNVLNGAAVSCVDNPDPEGQGFCQAGFSVDFTKEGTLVVGGPGSFYWQGQVITAGVAEILNGYSLKAVLRKVQGEKQTSAASDTYDDSYLGKTVSCLHACITITLQYMWICHMVEMFCVAVINSTNLTFIQNFTGEQVSLFQRKNTNTDLNFYSMLDDVLVGAPLYMDREFESKPREMGRVYLYLQEDALLFSPPITLTGTHVFGRYGSAIAPLGDINQDGYLDVAVGAPFAGDDRGGLVFIYNGQRSGLRLKASQVLNGGWASSAIPAGFGFTLRGDSDLDGNQYPGEWGGGGTVVPSHSPVVTVDAQLLLTPQILNPEDKSCWMPNSDTVVPCLRVDVCAKVSGIGIPDRVAVSMELQLDWLKQRGAVKRVLFLDSHQHHRTLQLLLGQQDRRRCLNHTIYLRDEAEFRDKLSPISVALNYSLDQTAPLPGLQLQPILDHYSTTFHQEQANILLDCGDDNMCIPDLKLSAKMDHTELTIGDDNPLLLTLNAANHGEGAYEAELQVRLPPEADYNGVERRREDLQILNCEHRVENESQVVVCDLGNPMPAGANVSTSSLFLLPSHFLFSNKDNSKSNPVNLTLSIVARADVDIRGVSLPAQVVLPFPRWEPKEKPVREDDIGPQVQHIYELHNKGPSSLSGTVLEVGWPSRHREEHLLYAMHIITDGPIRCHANGTLNPLELETSTLQDTPELLGFLRNSSSPTRRRRSVTSTQSYSSKTLNCSNIHCLMLKCIVGRLDQGQSAVVKVRSRLWAHTFLQRRNDHYLLNSTVSFQVTGMPYRIKPHTLPQQSNSIGTFVVWAIPDVSFAIPLWVIILAILLGLLVLAILTLAMWKCGFFDRARPPKDDDVSDREQLTAEKSTEA
uniref:Integrin alpha-2 domain-containing protein n=1 Tax=Pygocentrus nattereri TaxID=42514 RepID=A0AAR2JIU6_PYGNA